MLSQIAAAISEPFSSEASEKSLAFIPKASITTSMVARCPEPGFPMLTRLPFKPSKLLIPESPRTSNVNGSGWTENIARNFLNAPALLNLDVPL